ncbi:uncharacterized protein LOC143767322 [Ranitomeya variabilis]|uniref:uncharacterized protein LOC143767322 n=1 Tax=Ranitomeya variabilis TaxID=490064 RepID=UPI0040569106
MCREKAPATCTCHSHQPSFFRHQRQPTARDDTKKAPATGTCHCHQHSFFHHQRQPTARDVTRSKEQAPYHPSTITSDQAPSHPFTILNTSLPPLIFLPRVGGLLPRSDHSCVICGQIEGLGN